LHWAGPGETRAKDGCTGQAPVKQKQKVVCVFTA